HWRVHDRASVQRADARHEPDRPLCVGNGQASRIVLSTRISNSARVSESPSLKRRVGFELCGAIGKLQVIDSTNSANAENAPKQQGLPACRLLRQVDSRGGAEVPLSAGFS